MRIIPVKVPEGADPHEFLRDFISKEGLVGGVIIGIGGFEKATIGVFRGDSYDTMEIGAFPDHVLEVASLTGNYVVTKDGVSTHIHVVLARSHGEIYAGHLVKARVRPFLELFLIEHGDLTKIFDHRVGQK